MISGEGGYKGIWGDGFRYLEALVHGVLRTIFLNYFDIRTKGLDHIPKDGPAIIAGNHPSLIDGLLLYLITPRPIRFIIHKELYEHPLLHWVMKGMDFLPAQVGRHALDAAIDALKRGQALCIFPEGDAYDEGRMESLHQGLGVLALRTGAPVVPLGISGSDIAYPMGTWLPKPGPIALLFQAPVRYPLEKGAIEVGELVVVLADCRERILEAATLASIMCLVPRQRDWLRMGVAAIPLLALVAGLSATAPPGSLKPGGSPARERNGQRPRAPA